MGSVFLYLAIVLMWLCVLVPMWLRRDRNNETELVPAFSEDTSGDTVGDTVGDTPGGTTPDNDGDTLTDPAPAAGPSADASGPRSGDDSSASDAAPVPAGPAGDPPPGRVQLDREIDQQGGAPADQVGARSPGGQLGQVRHRQFAQHDPLCLGDVTTGHRPDAGRRPGRPRPAARHRHVVRRLARGPVSTLRLRLLGHPGRLTPTAETPDRVGVTPVGVPVGGRRRGQAVPLIVAEPSTMSPPGSGR